MTPATSLIPEIRDTLIRVPGKGTAKRTIRVDADLWDRAGEGAQGAGSDRTAMIKEFLRLLADRPADAVRLVQEWRASREANSAGDSE